MTKCQPLEPPDSGDPMQERQAKTLHRVLLGTLAVVIINAFLGLMMGPYSVRPLAMSAGVCLVLLAAMGIVRSGRVGLAMAVVTVSLWTIVTLSAVFVVGVNTAILVCYLAVAVMVGFLSGTRALVAFSVVTSCVIFLGAWATTHELMPEAVSEFTPYTSWLTVTAGLALTSMLISLSRRDTRDALDEALRNERAAVEASLEVEAASRLLETRARQQATVASLGQLALANIGPDELVEVAARNVREILGVDYVSVFELAPDGVSLILSAAVGWEDAPPPRVRVPLERATQAGHTLLADEPVIVEDWSGEERFPMPVGFAQAGVMSSVSVVIHGSEEPYGVFGAHATTRRQFSQDDVNFLQAVANLVTLMMRRAAMDDALHKSEEDLRQAQKMEAIGRFAGGIAHDFNNMLTAISGYNSMLLDGMADGDPGFEEAREIEHAASRAAALTQQILTFSRQQMLQPEILDLNEIIEKTKGMLERIIGEDLALEIGLAPDLGAIRADPGQIEQVLLNLAANARDATPGRGRLEIETANVSIGRGGSGGEGGPADGDYVGITFTDTGVGISEEIRARIFDPFFTTKGMSNGTGLGLSTVYGIVKQSGGHITVTSEPGQWTRFEILLPRSPERREPAADEPSSERIPRGSEIVLLVEDEAMVRRLTRRMIEALGYEVLEASNGIEALELARHIADPLPMLVTDVIMPELGGAELAEKLRKIHPEIRVLYVSGYSDDALAPDQLDGRSTSFLAKPFDQRELAEKLRDLMR